jgi:hypothetical protein
LRVITADLRGRDLLQLGPIPLEQSLAQDLDALGDRRLVGGLGAGHAAEQEAGNDERTRTCHRQVTTRHVHGFLLDRV